MAAGEGPIAMTMVDDADDIKILSKINSYIGVRQWQDAHMPIYGSFIGFDLILFLSRSRFHQAPYSLKDVFHSLRYSEGALRIFLRRLEKDGWIKLETWPGDRRNKKIIVSEKLFDIVFQYLTIVSDIGTPDFKLNSDV